jgi:hypothetical protein
MGKVQCVSIKHKTDTWMVLEKYLSNINTPLEKKIHDEYYNLKSKKIDSDLTHIPVPKRMHRFIKWYKMSTGNQDVILMRNLTDKLPRTPVKTRSSYRNTYSPMQSLGNSDEGLSIAFGQHSEIKGAHRRSALYTSIDFDSGEKQSISMNSNISSNQIERNLRQYYLTHRYKFSQRVSKAPPESYRWVSWLICSNVPEDRSEDLFNHYLKEPIEDNIDIQIKKDLNRTLSEIYDMNPQDSQNSLYRLLRTFSSIDKTVSYCQGMNFIAGFLLLLSDFNEVDCFYMLLNLFSETFTENFGIRGFFTEDFPLLKAYLYAFDFFFAKKFPTLHKHFKNLEIPDEVWIAKWFQTLYTICLPLNILVRFWDCLFSSGLEFLISFSLGLVQQLEKDLLKLEDAFDVIDFFKKMGPFFTTTTSKIHLNIEEVIQNAKRLNITRSNIYELIKEYEYKNSMSLAFLHIKYDMNIVKHLTFKQDDFSFDTLNRKNSKSTSVNNGDNIVIIHDVEDDNIDTDEYNMDYIDSKLNNYKLNVRLTPVTVIPEES